MTPKQTGDEWFVMRGDQQLAGPFKSHSEAWRWIDRHEGEPISPAEKKSDWIASKIIGGAA